MLLETGQTYERASIQRWFDTCPAERCTDPLTGQLLKSTEASFEWGSCFAWQQFILQ